MIAPVLPALLAFLLPQTFRVLGTWVLVLAPSNPAAAPASLVALLTRAPGDRRGRGRFQHREIDRLAHRLVAGVVGVQVIARVVLRQKLRRVRRVASGGIEIDD